MVKQKIDTQSYAVCGGRERNSQDMQSVHQVSVTTPTGTGNTANSLLEQVLEQSNMQRSWSRVKRNKGTAGIDGLSISGTHKYLTANWQTIKSEILSGRYMPQDVRCVEIPKPKGGTRMLGIPTVTDRLIQQAILQVLTPIFDPDFSDNSFGFRPGRSTHQAVGCFKQCCDSGYRWVVDMDLEKFFDNVNHDILMSRICRKVKDKQLLGLIRRYLQSGIMIDGVSNPSIKGTPQGSPLSPLLSNIMLDELDKELERRGHKFTRYADDCNIYVKSRRAGERVLESVSKFLDEKLKLKVNKDKSAVDRPWKRSFLGYTVTTNLKSRLKPSREAVKRFKAKVKNLFRIGRGRNIVRFIQDTLNPLLRGWGNYYKMSDVKLVFEELDGWLRRRLRCMRWRQWKRPSTRFKMLKRRRLPEKQAAKSAYNGRGSWWNSGAAHMNKAFPRSYFEELELISLERLVSKTDWLK